MNFYLEAAQLFRITQASVCRILQDRYYAEKLEINPADPEQVRKASAEFIRGIHWVLAYYYRGVASWDWFFPYHFAPMCSDLTAIGDVSPHFHLGEPFLPYWQLLAVLPAGSKDLLPKPYQVSQWLYVCPC